MPPQNAGKIITLTAFRRPDYLRQVLEALGRCTGIESYQVLAHVDPGEPEVVSELRRAGSMRLAIHENPAPLGCDTNTFAAVLHGFEHADFVIHLEDDTVPASDFLLFIEAMRSRYESDRSVLSISAYSKLQPAPSEYRGVFRSHRFVPWGWATWQDRWAVMRQAWCHDSPGWDDRLAELHQSRWQISPFLSRVRNIGVERGEHVPSREFHRRHHDNPFGSWAVEVDSRCDFWETGRRGQREPQQDAAAAPPNGLGLSGGDASGKGLGSLFPRAGS